MFVLQKEASINMMNAYVIMRKLGLTTFEAANMQKLWFFRWELLATYVSWFMVRKVLVSLKLKDVADTIELTMIPGLPNTKKNT